MTPQRSFEINTMNKVCYHVYREKDDFGFISPREKDGISIKYVTEISVHTGMYNIISKNGCQK